MSAAKKAKRKARREKIKKAVKSFVKKNKGELVSVATNVGRMIANRKK